MNKNFSAKLTAILILLLFMLNLVPPLFRENELYFDNIWFTLLYLILSYVCIVIPLIAKVYKPLVPMFFLGSGWFIAALIYEIMNWFVPDIILNASYDDKTFNQVVICFVLGMTFYITYRGWQNQKT